MQHSFDVELAKQYGLTEAILINHLAFWIEHNEANRTNFYDGKYWTFNSMKAYKEIFPYLTERKIRYALSSLEKNGIIEIGNYNKSSYDRTLWYAFSDFGKSILQKCKMETSVLSNRSVENVTPIPDILPDILPDSKPDINKGPFEEFAKDNKELLEALKAFEEMRKTIKKPLTEKAKQMVCNKLKKMAEPYIDQERYMIESLEQSTVNCYQGVFPVKDFEDNKPKIIMMPENAFPEWKPGTGQTWEDLVP